MLIPLPLVGLALASRIPYQRQAFRAFKPQRFLESKRYSRPVIKRGGKPFSFTLSRSINNLIKDLSTRISSVTKRSPEEDYNAIIKSYLPEGAAHLVPQYPANTGNYYFADVDGDTQKELVTAYRLGDANTIMVLKKQNGNWGKIAEASNDQFDSINFAGAGDMAGEGKDQLLIGWDTQDGHGELHGYSLLDEGLKDVFAHNYNHLEILDRAGNKRAAGHSQIALWNKKAGNAYEIDVKHWNGAELEAAKDQNSYFHNRVLPYYARAVKKVPYNPLNWYNLSYALEKAGLYRDAIDSADIGLSQNPDSALREEFTILKTRIEEKYPQ